MPKAPTREIVLGAQQKEIAAQLHHHRGADQDVLPSARHRRGRGHRVACGQGGIRRVAPRTAAKLRGQQRLMSGAVVVVACELLGHTRVTERCVVYL